MLRATLTKSETNTEMLSKTPTSLHSYSMNTVVTLSLVHVEYVVQQECHP